MHAFCQAIAEHFELDEDAEKTFICDANKDKTGRFARIIGSALTLKTNLVWHFKHTGTRE